MFRTELFNSMNHPNFAIPSQRTVFTSTSPVGRAGRITSTLTSARQLQLGLNLILDADLGAYEFDPRARRTGDLDLTSVSWFRGSELENVTISAARFGKRARLPKAA